MRDHLGNFMVAGNLGFARGVLLLEDCEGTFTWGVSGTGGDDVHEFAAAAAFMGTKGMRLKTRTTGAAAADNLAVEKAFGFPESGLLVCRLRVCPVGVAAFDYIQILLDVSAGVTGYGGCVQLDVAAGKVYYQAAGGGFVEMAGLAAPVLEGAFMGVELAVDLLANRYLSCMVNGLRADLSGVGMVSGGAVAYRFARLGVTIATVGAAPCELYVDSAYVGEFLDL